MNKKFFTTAIKGLSYIGQLGFDIVVPPMVLSYIARKLCQKFDLGNWIVVTAIILGILISIASTASFFKSVLAKTAKNQEKVSTISFRKHK